MSWAKIDDNFPQHPKATKAGDLACWLWVAGLCYAKRNFTDGFIPLSAVPLLTSRGTVALAEKLVRVGLWEHAKDAAGDAGYQIHDYAEENLTRAEIVQKRTANAAKLAAWRARKTPPTSVTAAPVTGLPGEKKRLPTSPSPSPSPRSEDLTHTAREIARALPDVADGVEGLLSDLEFTFGSLDFAQLAREAALYRRTAPGTATMTGADVLRRFCSQAKARGSGKGGPKTRAVTPEVAAAVARIEEEDWDALTKDLP